MIEVSGKQIPANKINQFHELLCSCNGRYSHNPYLTYDKKNYEVAIEFYENSDYESFWKTWHLISSNIKESFLENSLLGKLKLRTSLFYRESKKNILNKIK